MIKYKTVISEGDAEQIIEKSRFIGYVKPVKTREEAETFIVAIKSMHKNATHNVPAYIIGDNFELQWASDDGEPSGTSGAPMLHMLINEGITNVAIVVTRYFGGVKLGTGGLVRAYTGTAKLVLEKVGVCEFKERIRLKFKLDYPHFGKLQNMAASKGFEIKNTEFLDVIHVVLECDAEDSDEVIGSLVELTGGACNSGNIEIEKIIGRK